MDPAGAGAGGDPGVSPQQTQADLLMQAHGRRIGSHLDLIKAVSGLCGPLEFLLMKAVKGIAEEASAAVALAARTARASGAGAGA